MCNIIFAASPPNFLSKIVIVFATYIIILGTIIIMAPIHERGHAAAIRFFNPKAKIELRFAHTEYNCRDSFSDDEIRIIALCGSLAKCFVALIAAAVIAVVLNLFGVVINTDSTIEPTTILGSIMYSISATPR